MTLIQVFLVIEVTTNRLVTSRGLEDNFGLIISDRVMSLFLWLEGIGVIVGVIGGLLGGFFFKNKSFSYPCWFTFVFNLLSIGWILLAAAESA
jgi:hypothetical protein